VQISGVHDTHEEHELGRADGPGAVGVGEINGHQLWLRSIL